MLTVTCCSPSSIWTLSPCSAQLIPPVWKQMYLQSSPLLLVSTYSELQSVCLLGYLLSTSSREHFCKLNFMLINPVCLVWSESLRVHVSILLFIMYIEGEAGCWSGSALLSCSYLTLLEKCCFSPSSYRTTGDPGMHSVQKQAWMWPLVIFCRLLLPVRDSDRLWLNATAKNTITLLQSVQESRAEDICCRAPAPSSVSARQRHRYLSSSHGHKHNCLGLKQEKWLLFWCQFGLHIPLIRADQ